MKFVLVMVMALMITGCVTQRGFPPVHGISNFDRLDEKVYRGAQPSHTAIAELKKLGIVRVINLRLANDTAPYEAQACREVGIDYYNVPLSGLSAPTDAEVREVMHLVQTSPGPVFIHCQYGCDRTGTMCACWRIHKDGWNNAAALQEAVSYGMSSLEQGMRYYITHYRGK